MLQTRNDSGNVVPLALWLTLAALMLRGASEKSLVFHLGRLMHDVSGSLLALTGLHYLLMRGRDPKFVTAYRPCFWFLGTCVMAAVVGWFNGNAFLYWLLWGVLPFGTAAGAVLGETDGVFRRVANTLVHQLYVVVPFAFYVIVFVRPGSREEWYGPNGHGLGLVAASTLYFVPFLLPYLARLKPIHASAVLLGYIANFFLQLEAANRGGLLMCLVGWPAAAALCGMRRGAKWHEFSRSLRPVLFMLLLLAPALNLAMAAQPRLLDYALDRIVESVNRLTGSDSRFEGTNLDLISQQTMDTSLGEFAGSGARSSELRQFVAQLQPLDWFMGRGFGGTWAPHSWDRPHVMVHVGFGHFLLLGGIPLVLTFCWLVYCAARRTWAQLAELEAAPGALCYGLTVIAGFLQHGAFADESGLGLFWLAIGMVLAPRLVRNKAFSPSNPQQRASALDSGRNEGMNPGLPAFPCAQNSAMFRR